MSTLILMGLMPKSNDHSLAARLTGSVELDIDLPQAHRRGLIAITAMALMSLIATSTLLAFITYRLIFWRGSYTRYIGYNQYIILIYNLVLADFQQSLAFIICLKWILKDKIKSGTVGCFLQGMWLQIGDPGSVVWGRKMSYKFFVCFVVGIWGFVALMVVIPLAMHGGDVFVPSGAWCWIREEYETTRLWTHYIWIFLAEFGTVILYAIMYLQLRKQIAASAILGNSQMESLKRLRRVVGYMTIYPIVYIILSLPLAAGRMATANGNEPSIIFFCCAGAIITSSGLVDVVLYTLTRRNLIIDSEPSQDHSYNIFSSSKGKRGETNLTTITADPTRKLGGTFNDDIDRDGSTDNIVSPGARVHDHEMNPLGKVYQETTIEITHEPAYPSEESSERSSKDDFPSTKPPHVGWRR
ncbi:unnamed protein product [Penicillium glandicola]